MMEIVSVLGMGMSMILLEMVAEAIRKIKDHENDVDDN